MENQPEFKLKKYSFGWKVWIKYNGKSLLLGFSKTKDGAEEIVKSITNNSKITYTAKDYNYKNKEIML